MPWFKVDDKLHDHRKARAAKKAAMGVWVLAGSWAADNITDGFVPASVLARWGTRADAAVLVNVGLWVADEQDGEAGWRFHEWAERQPTRAAVEAERQDARLRMAELRAKRQANKRTGSGPVRANDERSSAEVRSAPTRPDPTITSGGADEPPAASAQTYVAEWIEHSQKRPPSDIIGQVSKRLKVLVGDGIEPAVIRRGLAEWDRRNLHPSVLPSIVHEAQKAKAQATVTRLPRADELELPPDGLSPAEYAAWELGQREKRRGRS